MPKFTDAEQDAVERVEAAASEFRREVAAAAHLGLVIQLSFPGPVTPMTRLMSDDMEIIIRKNIKVTL